MQPKATKWLIIVCKEAFFRYLVHFKNLVRLRNNDMQILYIYITVYMLLRLQKVKGFSTSCIFLPKYQVSSFFLTSTFSTNLENSGHFFNKTRGFSWIYFYQSNKKYWLNYFIVKLYRYF